MSTSHTQYVLPSKLRIFVPFFEILPTLLPGTTFQGWSENHFFTRCIWSDTLSLVWKQLVFLSIMSTYLYLLPSLHLSIHRICLFIYLIVAHFIRFKNICSLPHLPRSSFVYVCTEVLWKDSYMGRISIQKDWNHRDQSEGSKNWKRWVDWRF